MGNKQATGGEPSSPRMMLSTMRNNTLLVGPKINESDKSGVTKTSEVGSLKPRAERETWGQSTHKDRLSIVNITRKQENQYLVEMADGSTYLGGLEQSQFSGYGEVEWKSTKKRYRGEWRCNFPHGFGIEETQKFKYEGNFTKGLKEGYGKICFQNGERFLGNFQIDKFNGYGVYRWQNGTEYRGNFKDGLFDGIGSLITRRENEEVTTLKALWYQGEISDFGQSSFG